VHKRPTPALLGTPVATESMALPGLVALPAVSGAAAKVRPYYLSLGDSYSIRYQPGIGGTPGYTKYVATKGNNFIGKLIVADYRSS
jgi:hypothetical protein